MINLLQNKTKQLKDEITLPPSIADRHIGLRAYLGDGIYLLENSDLATMFHLDGIADEHLTESQLLEASSSLHKFVAEMINGVPSIRADQSTVVQIICSQREQHERLLSNHDQQRNNAGEIIKAEEEHLLSSGIVKRRFFLCIRWTPPKKSLSFQLKAYPFKEDLEKKKALFLREIKNKLLESSLTLQPLSCEEVISYFNSVFLRGKAPSFSLGAESVASFHQNIINDAALGTHDGFDFKDGNIRVFTFSELPTYFVLGRLKNLLDLLPLKNFEMVWTLSHGFYRCSVGHTIKKMFFAKGPSFQKIFKDLINFEEEIHNQNPAGCFSLRLIAYDVNEDLESKIISAAIQATGVPIIREAQIAPHLIVTSLPMNCPSMAHKINGRCRFVLLNRGLCFAPIYTCSFDPQAARIWSSRSGLPSSFDVFNKGGNNHLCILGNSESGKSCLMAQFLIEFLWRFDDGIIRVIDKKTSYEKLSDLFKGKIVSFSESFLKENPYSPFSYESWDEDDVLLTVVFLQNAIEKINPGVKLSSLQTELLSEAIKLSALDHQRNTTRLDDSDCDPHFTWVDIQKKLPVAAEKKDTNRDLAIRALEELRSLTVSFDKGGQFSFLFCAHEKSDLKTDGCKLVVYDLDGISDPRLQVIAAQLAFLKIARDLKKTDRRLRKLIVFEELGVLVRGESQESSDIATRFMRNVVKTARKIGAQAIALTNELSDYTETDGGRAFWQIATQKLFLPQSDAEKERIKNLEGELSKADIDIINDLYIKKGFYSQGYLISKPTDFRGSFLIPLSITMNALVTTNNKEEAHYKDLRTKGLSVEEALDKMANEHPYGRGL